MGARVCSQKECCSNGYSLREIYTVSALLPNPLTAEELWKIVLKKKKTRRKTPEARWHRFCSVLFLQVTHS